MFSTAFLIWLKQFEQGLFIPFLIHIPKTAEMLFNKPYNIGFLIIGFMVYHLKGQLTGRTVALQSAFTDVEHLAEIEVIQQHIAVGKECSALHRCGRLHLFEFVETLHNTPHPIVEMFLVYIHGQSLGKVINPLAANSSSEPTLRWMRLSSNSRFISEMA